MKSILSFFAICFFSLNLIGQISHGGQPFDWHLKDAYALKSEKLTTPDLKSFRAEDEINDKLNGVPYRYGANIEVDLDILNSGEWLELDNGDGVWRLALESEGARSINFVFDIYDIPKGGKVFVFTPDKSNLLGSFTAENRSKQGSLGVGLILSDEVIVEYHEPAEVRGQGYLHINNVTHGYRDVLVNMEDEAKGAFGNSGACNINVNCPEGIPFDIQKRSVALIVVNNNAICTGAMINNVAQNGTPFFLTADHCTPSNPGNVGNWVFYFNHESATCSGNDGPTNQSVSGSTLLARNQESDFALLELDNTPPPSYNVCYSGWDASDLSSGVNSAYGIHHPSGDIKKICFEEDAPYKENIGSFVNQTWLIDEWELGVTEGGSSGSPLFNQNGLIIGQLAGGQAACAGTVNNGEHDFYGRFGVSWSFGSTPSTALRFWLDPGNTGILSVPNSCASSQPSNDALLGLMTGVEDILCDLSAITPSINVFNAGNNPITSLELEVNFNGESEIINWNGEIPVTNDALVGLGTFLPEEGENNLSVEILSVNENADGNPEGNATDRDILAFDNGILATINIDFDDYPEETSWDITNSAGTVLYQGGPYTDDSPDLNEAICLGTDCYFFTIYDDYGDGICCGFGSGSYQVIDQFGSVLASGGEFSFSETSEICFVLETENGSSNDLSIYPNPSQDHFMIAAGDRNIESMQIFDIQGRMVVQRTLNESGTIRVESNSLKSGVYVILLQSNEGIIRRRLVVEN